jgi:UDP-glucose 4-epimerase
MIVVVGANGFLGRHMCELLEQKHAPAVAVSRNPDRAFFEKFAPSLRVMDAVDFSSSAGHDVLAEASAIIYFAWQSNPSTFAQAPWREVSENVQPAFEFFLRAAEVAREAKIVFLSSGGTVYGSEGTTPKSEEKATHPISSYGLGKVMAEEALRFVGRTKSVAYAILRPSNPVGRWQLNNKMHGVVGAALRAAKERVPMRLFGGAQVRDFIDADDVAEAIFAASCDRIHRAVTWNVGSGIGITITEMLNRISKIIGRPIPVEHAPARAIDVSHVVLDCQKIAKELGWNPKMPIERSISSLWNAMGGSPCALPTLPASTEPNLG